jgi:hypothetical protein
LENRGTPRHGGTNDTSVVVAELEATLSMNASAVVTGARG